MSFNIRDYVSDDHIESIGEIAKSQSAIIQALSLENSKLQTQLQQKENIINELKERSLHYSKQIDGLLEIKEEIREKIENVQILGLRSGKTLIATLLNEISEILDKEVIKSE